MYTTTVVDNKEHCMGIMRGMETAFTSKDEDYFVKVLLNERSLVLRVHAVCILAEVGSEKCIPTLADVLFNDPDPLVRHEAAFSLGQIGLPAANVALEKAALTDSDPIVRHEAAAALGSIGSTSAEATLEKVLADKADIVRNSALASLFNIEFLKQYSVGASARERAPRP
jgi:deoxyhypusine monooxygenase